MNATWEQVISLLELLLHLVDEVNHPQAPEVAAHLFNAIQDARK